MVPALSLAVLQVPAGAGRLRHGVGRPVFHLQRQPRGLLVEAKERIRERVEAGGGFHISPEETQKRMLAVSSTEHGEYDFR